MNNSQLFKQAHSVARQTVKQVGDYQIAFTLALRELIAENKKPNYKTISINVLDSESIATNSAILSAIILTVLLFTTLSLFAPIIGALVGCITWLATILLLELSQWAMFKALSFFYVDNTQFEDAINDRKVFIIE
mgnify:CR=1 FL=1